MEPIPPVPYSRPAIHDVSVRHVSHPAAAEGGRVIITEGGGQAIVPAFHYPMGRRCLCGECRCYCRECKEYRDKEDHATFPCLQAERA